MPRLSATLIFVAPWRSTRSTTKCRFSTAGLNCCLFNNCPFLYSRTTSLSAVFLKECPLPINSKLSSAPCAENRSFMPIVIWPQKQKEKSKQTTCILIYLSVPYHNRHPQCPTISQLWRIHRFYYLCSVMQFEN